MSIGQTRSMTCLELQLSRGLEQLDGVAIGILDLDLLAARPRLHVIPKMEAGFLQSARTRRMTRRNGRTFSSQGWLRTLDDLHPDQKTTPILERIDETDTKRDYRHSQCGSGCPVVGFEMAPRRGDDYKPQQRGNHDDGIEAGALPVAASQVDPHSELIECQRQADSIHEGGDPHCARTRRSQQEIRANGGQQEDAVVEMMDVRAAEMEVDVGNPARDDQEHEEPRRNEREEERREDVAREVSS